MEEHMIKREQVIAAIYQTLKEYEFVQALCVAGSEAFNRTDEYSDIDIRVLAEPEYNNNIFLAAENALNILGKIDDCYMVPPHTLNGHAQRFYKLKEMSPFHIIDFVILQDKHLTDFLDINRCGKPVVMLDRFGKLLPRPTSLEKLEQFQQRLGDLQQQFKFLARILVERAIIRNHFAEAVSFIIRAYSIP
jgi:predicted nucleotidyltransferase